MSKKKDKKKFRYFVKVKCPRKKCKHEYVIEAIQPMLLPCECKHGNCDVEELSACFGSASWYCEKCDRGGVEAISHRVENPPKGFKLGDIKPRGLW